MASGLDTAVIANFIDASNGNATFTEPDTGLNLRQMTAVGSSTSAGTELGTSGGYTAGGNAVTIGKRRGLFERPPAGQQLVRRVDHEHARHDDRWRRDVGLGRHAQAVLVGRPDLRRNHELGRHGDLRHRGDHADRHRVTIPARQG